jgi:hypothetical protein
MSARGNAQQRIKRRISVGAAFVTNGVVSFQLPRNYDVETVGVRIAGSWTLPAALATGSNGFKPVLRSDAPFGLIQRVEVVLEGRQTIVSVPARILAMANVWRRRQYFAMTNVDTYGQTQNPGLVRNVATASSVLTENTTINFTGTFYIDFQAIMGVRPKDTNLRAGGLQTFELRLITSDLTGLLYQPSATLLTTPFSPPAIGATLPANTTANLGTLNATTIDIFDLELEELKSGTGQMSVPGFVQRWTNQNIALGANNAALETLLPTDNFIGAIIIAPTIGNEAQDNVVTDVIARRGTDQRISLPAPDLIALNERDYMHQRFAGYMIADFMHSGATRTKLADMWNVQGGADTRLVTAINQSGANVNMDVTTVEYIPVKQA